MAVKWDAMDGSWVEMLDGRADYWAVYWVAQLDLGMVGYLVDLMASKRVAMD